MWSHCYSIFMSISQCFILWNGACINGVVFWSVAVCPLFVCGQTEWEILWIYYLLKFNGSRFLRQFSPWTWSLRWIDDVLSIPFSFLIFYFFPLCVWMNSCFLDLCCCLVAVWIYPPALYLSLCDWTYQYCFEGVPFAEMVIWYCSRGMIFTVIWWSESGGWLLPSAWSVMMSCFSIWIWLISSVFVWDFMNWMFYIGTKLQIFDKVRLLLFLPSPFPLYCLSAGRW